MVFAADSSLMKAFVAFDVCEQSSEGKVTTENSIIFVNFLVCFSAYCQICSFTWYTVVCFFHSFVTSLYKIITYINFSSVQNQILHNVATFATYTPLLNYVYILYGLQEKRRAIMLFLFTKIITNV